MVQFLNNGVKTVVVNFFVVQDKWWELVYVLKLGLRLELFKFMGYLICIG
jgi:hypothetical protein